MEVYEKHPELFHYTSCVGISGILTSQSLRATHYRFLNDTSELQLMRPEFAERIFPFVKERLVAVYRTAGFKERRQMKKAGGAISIATNEAKAFVEALYRTSFGDSSSGIGMAVPYITSFCAHTSDQEYERRNGLLSQWRGYARGGYAIVFDTRELCDRYKAEWTQYYCSAPCYIGDVVYQGDKKSFEDEFHDSLERIKHVLRGRYENSDWQLGKIYGDVVSMFSRLKHRGFYEEREVRSVTFPMTNEIEDEYKRADPTYVSPNQRMKNILQRDDSALYIEALQSDGDSSSLPIKRIIVGPQNNQDQAAARIEGLVGNRIEVHRSETPLVWPGA